uniref:Uncharacterized protein n=1 Tax=Candidatus Kentrum sp. UNK TaxID=2126344 RepID=A0A451ASW3_9GAMM|nr:MAG: hypothetical protein BECKUNK1418G_GA0071005_13162 [Candidatus Kentron sp. UNK]VFK73821.1 MAG: hypothetical protein BECKUNK1418H_GA0071006_13062 [Candidatus Kentron sp. UNK]
METMTQPHWGCGSVFPSTQGSRCAATLGWITQPLWGMDRAAWNFEHAHPLYLALELSLIPMVTQSSQHYLWSSYDTEADVLYAIPPQQLS